MRANRSHNLLGSFTEGGVHSNRQWPVSTSSIQYAENRDTQSRKTGSHQRSWAEQDSPVSVIGHAARNHNLMMQMQQLGETASNPASSGGSTGMQEPPAESFSPANHHAANHHYPFNNTNNSELGGSGNGCAAATPASQYADLLSERVQQAFRKSHEIMRPQQAAIKTWPTDKRMEWLSLQQDPPFSAAASGLHKVFHNLHSRPPHHPASSDEDGVSIYSSRRDQEDEEEEDSVIDFFPSANRASPAAVRSRRAGSSKERPVNESGTVTMRENVRRGSAVAVGRRRGAGRRQEQEEYESEGRVSMSHKWDDAERWITSPARACCSSVATSGRSATPHHLSASMADLQKSVKAAARCPQPIPVQAWKPLSDPTSTQDKHVPEGRATGMREVGTEFETASKRDMATQSTPAEWSRCQSPEEERPLLLSCAAPEKPSAGGPDYHGQPTTAAAQRTSPPRHNTPARRSVSCSKHRGSILSRQETLAEDSNGKLNLLELESCHLDKLKLARDLPPGTSCTWQLVTEEEEEADSCEKMLLERKSPQQHHLKVNMLEARVSAWEDVERAKYIARFKREEARIEAWENLQHAEVDAELRKLEVKLEKMRFEGREKIMGRLMASQKRAQEMRGVAEAHKVEQLARLSMRANHIRKSGHLPASTFNVMCSLTTKIKPNSNFSFS